MLTTLNSNIPFTFITWTTPFTPHYTTHTHTHTLIQALDYFNVAQKPWDLHLPVVRKGRSTGINQSSCLEKLDCLSLPDRSWWTSDCAYLFSVSLERTNRWNQRTEMFRENLSFTYRRHRNLSPSLVHGDTNMKSLKYAEESIPYYAQYKNNPEVRKINYAKMIYIVNILLHGPHDFVLTILMQPTLLNICSGCVMIRKCRTKIPPHLNDVKASKTVIKDLTVTLLLDIHWKAPREAFHAVLHIKS